MREQPQLAQEVEALLQARQSPPSSCSTPRTVSDHRLIALPARSVRARSSATYELVQAIGEGGMGAVWMAEQMPPSTEGSR